MSERTYNIGQVIYVVSQKTQQVVPVQVVERIVKSTLQGEEVIYKVVGPRGEGPHDLKQIDGDLYIDGNIIREELRRKAVSAVDKMVDRALAVAAQQFQAARSVQDGGLAFKQSSTPVNGTPVAAAQKEDPITLEDGEIELPPGPDGVPRKARVRSVSTSPKRDG